VNFRERSCCEVAENINDDEGEDDDDDDDTRRLGRNEYSYGDYLVDSSFLGYEAVQTGI
jgi:hypothetical protein